MAVSKSKTSPSKPSPKVATSAASATPEPIKRRVYRWVLDARTKAQICALVAMGYSRYRAAGVVGCASKTILNTLRRDPEFVIQMRQAEMRQEIALLKRIDDASKAVCHWRAAAWMLERQHPNRYGRRAAGTMTPEQIGTVLAQFADIIKRGIRNLQDRQKVGTELKLLTNALAGQVTGDPA